MLSRDQFHRLTLTAINPILLFQNVMLYSYILKIIYFLFQMHINIFFFKAKKKKINYTLSYVQISAVYKFWNQNWKITVCFFMTIDVYDPGKRESIESRLKSSDIFVKKKPILNSCLSDLIQWSALKSLNKYLYLRRSLHTAHMPRLYKWSCTFWRWRTFVYSASLRLVIVCEPSRMRVRNASNAIPSMSSVYIACRRENPRSKNSVGHTRLTG